MDAQLVSLIPAQPNFPPRRPQDAASKAHATDPRPSLAKAPTSIARIAANRANARKSTGPRTAAGKATVSHNARRHGLSRPLLCEGTFTPHVEALAREIAGEDAGGERLALACNIAAAQLDLARIRNAKVDLQNAANFGSTDAQFPCDWSALTRLERLDRYEQRVITRRRRAIWEFCKSKPRPEVAPTPAPEASEGTAQDFCKSKPIPAVEDTPNNKCGVSVGASVCSSAFTRPLSTGGEEEPPEGGTTNKGEQGNFCKTEPTGRGVKNTKQHLMAGDTRMLVLCGAGRTFTARAANSVRLPLPSGATGFTHL
jgi:hypothetical protein